MIAKYLMTSDDLSLDYEFDLLGLYVGQDFPFTNQRR